jgi:amidase
VVEGVLAAGRALEAEGYEVVEIAPPMLEDAYFNWAETMWTTLKVQKPLIDAVMGEGGRTFLNLTNEDIPDYTPEMTMAMHQSRHRISRAWHQFFYDFPVIVGPTWTQPPFAHGYDISSKDAAMSVVELFRFVLPANLMGLPAACVPTTVVNGLPMGAQIIADRFREDIALSAAEAIEQRCGVLTPIDPRP